MIFGIKEKLIILTHSVFLAIATNIPMLLMTGFVVQGYIYKQMNKHLKEYNLHYEFRD